jgi:hypothetical protein
VWWTWTTYAYVADLFDADDGPSARCRTGHLRRRVGGVAVGHAPAGLLPTVLAGRAAVAAAVLVLAAVGHDMSALALLAVAAAVTLGEVVFEGLRA